MIFFGCIAAIALFVAVGMFIPIFVLYLRLGAVPNFPTLIVLTGVAVAGLLSFACGCILDTIKKYNDRMMLMLGQLLVKKQE